MATDGEDGSGNQETGTPTINAERGRGDDQRTFVEEPPGPPTGMTVSGAR